MRALLAGSFDPFTLGHLDLVVRGSALFDGLTVAVAAQTGKNTASIADRVEIVKLSLEDVNDKLKCDVRVVTFDGLLTDHIKSSGDRVLLRGIRGSADLMYERELEAVYRSQFDGVTSVLLMSAPGYEHVSSTTVRQLARLGGTLDGYVSPSAVAKVKQIYG